MSATSHRIAFDPARLARHFSARQPVDSAVLSVEAALPACCLETTLRIRAGSTPERIYCLELPLQTSRPNETPQTPARNPGQQIMTLPLPAPVIQVLAGSEGARLLVEASGPAECPAGRENVVLVTGGGGETLTRAVPFAAWAIPLISPLDLEEADAPPEALLAQIHPCRTTELRPAVCQISVPACRGVGLRATVAIFPDLRWQGSLTVCAEPDAATQKGFRMILESEVTCRCGAGEWQPGSWAEAVALCPWLECVETLARCVSAFGSLQPNARLAGLDNPRLSRREPLAWTWPRCQWRIESSLVEARDHGLLRHRLSYEVAAEPLLAVSGETSLLAAWLENPLWWERLAPLRVGAAQSHVSDLMQELGLWLTAEGLISLRLRRQEHRPVSPGRVEVETRGGIAVEIEGRSARDYEAILVRAGRAGQREKAAGFTIACAPPPAPPRPEATAEPCSGLVDFSGLTLDSLEKLRPGIRLRRRQNGVLPLASLLLPRAWPASAAGEPTPVPWHRAS